VEKLNNREMRIAKKPGVAGNFKFTKSCLEAAHDLRLSKRLTEENLFKGSVFPELEAKRTKRKTRRSSKPNKAKF